MSAPVHVGCMYEWMEKSYAGMIQKLMDNKITGRCVEQTSTKTIYIQGISVL
jgi:hypothetical protein